MKLNKFHYLLILFLPIFISGCSHLITQPSSQSPQPQLGQDGQEQENQEVINACVNECKNALEDGHNLSSGPCLLDPISEDPSWVCDVAHSPRQAVDNLQENQCQAFRTGKAIKFIEVSPECEVIKIYEG